MACEIFQLGATTSKSTFSVNILPEGCIDVYVTKLCGGISVKLNKHGERCLMKDGKVLKAETGRNGMNSFIQWIKNCKKVGNHDKVILCAHGALDMPALLNNVANANLFGEFKLPCLKYVSTL